MLQGVKKSSVVIQNLKGKVKFPEKLKGTILEKWAIYWKNLCIDYRQMLQDLRTDMQDRPLTAMKYAAILSTSYLLAKNNPNEYDFKDTLKTTENQVAMVSSECLNKDTIEHLRFIETCYNERIIHYASLGLFSVMYTSDISESCDLYKAHCSYMKPTLFGLPSRIVDIGLMGRWWNIYKRSTNFDVNFD